MNFSKVVLFVALGAVVGFGGGLFAVGDARQASHCSLRGRARKTDGLTAVGGSNALAFGELVSRFKQRR